MRPKTTEMAAPMQVDEGAGAASALVESTSKEDSSSSLVEEAPSSGVEEVGKSGGGGGEEEEDVDMVGGEEGAGGVLDGEEAEEEEEEVGAASSVQVAHVFPLTNYKIGQKGPKRDKDANVKMRMQRYSQIYANEGMRRTVEGVILVHRHGHPHVLLLQTGHGYFKLPGGKLKPGESETSGLLRKLNSKLGTDSIGYQPDWRVGELLGQWWRPHFEPPMYPYIPAHITKPKEVLKLFLVHLPEACHFSVPSSLKLLAVPVFELLDNVPRYGPILSCLPALLSRFTLRCLSEPLPAPASKDTEEEEPAKPEQTPAADE